MWKGRKELPSLKKTNLSFDIDKLRQAVSLIENKSWNACIGGPYDDLREAYGSKLSKIAYNKTNDEVDINKAETYRYQQMALTQFNPEYEIPKDRNSGSRWDNTFRKGNKKYDERAYNAPIDDLPEYLKEVFNTFGPKLTRVTLAKLMPGEEVAPHIDYDTTFSTRYHIAVYTNEGCKLNDTHIPADGSVWFLNPGKMHSAVNNGKTPRTHIIFKMDSQELIQ